MTTNAPKIKKARNVEDVIETPTEVFTGWDKGVDYRDIFPQLVSKYHALKEIKATRYNINKRIYLLIALIQLKNGSRVSEACDAFTYMLAKGFQKTATVKIAKSESKKSRKLDNGEKEQFTTKARYRTMTFPQEWIKITDIDKIAEMTNHLPAIQRLETCVNNFLARNYKINTHSLRYSRINYLINVEKTPLNLVAGSVGHKGLGQLVTYTQNKEIDKLHDL